MVRQRSFLSLILGLILVFVVSLNMPAMAAKKSTPTYTAAQLEQIQVYRSNLKAVSDRLPELVPMIEKRQWTDVRDFIHGPMGELRVRMNRLTRSLLPQEQAAATAAAREVFEHLIELDEAALAQSYSKMVRSYGETLRDLNAYFAAVAKG
ncbi:photosystem II protein PsbQ [Leptolyngbya sp. 'hensonii']|uniref:photosystem II protein PsbQ n=1 Tax=Leptolyngbya sp. 'hensonii' TaxID=1922337 RepID=UPI00094FEADA|nr:photosystem II protein PsbQ [Leptolyngbya sp. 'hensonii']OLP20399.1 photosystem II protein PsbQ [Leptolyngbya sp. 'hensonii']